MVIVTELANGLTEIYEGANYTISKTKDFHPLILKVSVFDNGLCIKSVKRPFSFFYKYFTFKSCKVQEKLKELEEAQQKSASEKAEKD